MDKTGQKKSSFSLDLLGISANTVKIGLGSHTCCLLVPMAEIFKLNPASKNLEYFEIQLENHNSLNFVGYYSPY